jgi:hypothetical protein
MIQEDYGSKKIQEEDSEELKKKVGAFKPKNA